METHRDPTLEKLHACSQWSHDNTSSEEVLRRHVEHAKNWSEMARDRFIVQRIPYGPTSEQATEWIIDQNQPSDGKSFFVFIHGGYWQEMSLDSSSFLAKNEILDKFTFVSVGYDLCPTVTLPQLLSQVEKGIKSILDHIPNDSLVYVVGHSAGGHLAACIMSTFSQETRIKAYIILSGVLDCGGVIYTSLNDKIRMDLKTSQELNPILREAPIMASKTHLLLAYAQFDSPLFKRMAKAFERKLKESKNVICQVCEVPDEDHFEMVENMAIADSLLMKKLLEIQECVHSGQDYIDNHYESKIVDEYTEDEELRMQYENACQKLSL